MPVAVSVFARSLAHCGDTGPVIDSPAIEQVGPIHKLEQTQRPWTMAPCPLQIDPAGASQLEPLHPGMQAQSPATSRP
jgi:hypothetical protein